MSNQFLTNYTETTFLEKIKDNLRHCKSFEFSVSFIKKAGLVLWPLVPDNINSYMPHNSTFAVGYPGDDWYHETKEKILNSPDFQRFPCYTREDFFDYLMECGLDREEAFYFSELIRKGRAARSPELDELSIPEELNPEIQPWNTLLMSFLLDMYSDIN